MKAMSAWCVLGLAVAALNGCYESPDANFYSPGEYKGQEDPLLEKQASQEQQDTLRERFSIGQEDR